jgi:hypothetical protein
MKLASRLALEIDIVDPSMIQLLTPLAADSLRISWDGDNDGSPTTIQPMIGYYTK